MGTNQNTPFFNHPLIKLVWIEEILQFTIDYKIEKWSQLFRDLSIFSINRNFALKTFNQIRVFLIEAKIVENRHDERIVIIGRDNFPGLREYLISNLLPSNNYLNCIYEYLSNYPTAIAFNELPDQLISLMPLISNRSTFLQVIDFYQFLGCGVVVHRDRFIPYSSIHKEDPNILVTLVKMIKNIDDPRILSYSFSNHELAESIIAENGEDFIPISDETDIQMRIPFSALFNDSGRLNYLKVKKELDTFSKSLYQIAQIKNKKDYDNLIFTLKILYDTLFCGNVRYGNEELANHDLNLLQQTITKMGIRFSKSKAHNIKLMYKRISSLFFGSLFYNNFLHRPQSIFQFNPELIKSQLGLANTSGLKLSKSKTPISLIFTALNSAFQLSNSVQLKGITGKHKAKYDAIKKRLNSFLPNDIFERDSQLKRLNVMIFITKEMQYKLLKFKPQDYFPEREIPDEVLSLFTILNFERVIKNEIIAELLKIIEFLDYTRNSLINTLHPKQPTKHNLEYTPNLKQFLDVLDDLTIQVERKKYYEYNQNTIELLYKLIQDMGYDIYSKLDSDATNNKKMYSIEELLHFYTVALKLKK